MLRRQYRETAECGSRASLTLARDDSGTIVLSSAKWPHINTSSPRRRGPMLRRQYRETAEYGSRASLTLARDDSGTIVLPQRNDRTPTRRPREGGDPYAAAISRNCGVWIPGLAHARPGRQRHINPGNDRVICLNAQVIPVRLGPCWPMPTFRISP